MLSSRKSETLAAVESLLASADEAVVLQGLALLEGLVDPQLWTFLAA